MGDLKKAALARAWILCFAATAGCFNFEALSRDWGKDLSANTSDLSANDLTVGAADLVANALADLAPTPDLRPSADLLPACPLDLPPSSGIAYVDATADPGNLACTKVAPCKTLAQAINAFPNSGDLPVIILMKEGIYTHDATLLDGAYVIMGSFFGGFDCRSSMVHSTVIRGGVAGQPAIEGVVPVGKELALDGVRVVGPSGDMSSQPLVGVRLSGGGALRIINSQVSSHEVNQTGSVMRAVEVQKGTVSLQGAELSVPMPGTGSLRQGLYLCGANADIRDSRIIVDGNGTNGAAAVAAVDDGTQCTGGGNNSIFAFRSLFVVTTGQSLEALSLHWTRLAGQFQQVQLQRSLVRVQATTSSVAIAARSPLALQVYGSTLNASSVDLAHAIRITNASASPNPILNVQDSILVGQTMPISLGGASYSPESGFGRNLWAYGNGANTVIDNNGELISQSMMTNAFAADMNTRFWGDARFADPNLQLDGIHLGVGSPAINQALMCWGTEMGKFNFDFEGTANLGGCDLGGDER